MYSVNIDFKSRKPIYDQLVDGFCELILRGIMSPGEQLPSVRALSAELGINPNTIQRAYSELERQGIIYSVSAKGSFVCEDIEPVRHRAKNAKKDALLCALSACINAGVTYDEILKIVTDVTKGDKDEQN